MLNPLPMKERVFRTARKYPTAPFTFQSHINRPDKYNFWTENQMQQTLDAIQRGWSISAFQEGASRITHSILVMLRKLRMMGNLEWRRRQSQLKVVSCGIMQQILVCMHCSVGMHVHCTCSLVSVPYNLAYRRSGESDDVIWRNLGHCVRHLHLCTHPYNFSCGYTTHASLSAGTCKHRWGCVQAWARYVWAWACM